MTTGSRVVRALCAALIVASATKAQGAANIKTGLTKKADKVLSALEKGGKEAGRLRREFRCEADKELLGDVATSGGLIGFAIGKIIVGDPFLMAAAGAAGFAFTHMRVSNSKAGQIARQLGERVRTYRQRLKGWFTETSP